MTLAHRAVENGASAPGRDDRDLECVVRAPGDYQMDLRRLQDGSIDAAYVGSTLSPEQVAGEEGCRLLAWVGDHSRSLLSASPCGIYFAMVPICCRAGALACKIKPGAVILHDFRKKPQLGINASSPPA